MLSSSESEESESDVEDENAQPQQQRLAGSDSVAKTAGWTFLLCKPLKCSMTLAKLDLKFSTCS